MVIESACNAGDLGLIPVSGRSPGEVNGYPLQYSCLEKFMDEAWQATVHGVMKSQTWLSNYNHIITDSYERGTRIHCIGYLILEQLLSYTTSLQIQLLLCILIFKFQSLCHWRYLLCDLQSLIIQKNEVKYAKRKYVLWKIVQHLAWS